MGCTLIMFTNFLINNKVAKSDVPGGHLDHEEGESSKFKEKAIMWDADMKTFTVIQAGF